jgi:hypothetical protein
MCNGYRLRGLKKWPERLNTSACHVPAMLSEASLLGDFVRVGSQLRLNRVREMVRINPGDIGPRLMVPFFVFSVPNAPAVAFGATV